MQSLIKKDLLSLKSISMIFIPLTILFQFFITWYVSSMSGFLLNDLSGIIFFIVLFNLLMSYGLITHICNAEELSGVNKRIRSLPITVSTIVVAKFTSTLIILTSINAITFGTLFFVQAILGHPVGIGDSGGAVLLINALILLFISFYLFAHFTFGSYIAVWIGRLFIVTAVFLPMFLSWPSSLIFGVPIGVITPLLNQFFFISTLILVGSSMWFSIQSYRDFYIEKKKLKMTMAFFSTFIILMLLIVTSAVALSSPPLNTKEEIIDHISVERLVINYKPDQSYGREIYGIEYEVILTASPLSNPELLQELGISLVFSKDDPLFDLIGHDMGVHYSSWSFHQNRPTFWLNGETSPYDMDEDQLLKAISESRPQIAIFENFQIKAPTRLINY
ncbi:ABC-2 transporter permease [Alkalihalobacterium chitinilyticum]|uniref:ABC-2 transporter permease n=1 Tax=Alkalihalobacterium chitinilyticum TaxID=2980103 RepID=A0ABT5VE57_9BACI|nr:ABC-2 transporter permease [Alkalihalobacterium chitinilyticum]MDE5413750.1 ABC-2 transporter permease [Alkalihalobacterium chitinilyticum]